MRNLILLIICLSPLAAFACSCEGQNDVQTEYNSVDFVLMGKIAAVDTLVLIDSNQIKNPPDPRLIHELNQWKIPILRFHVHVLRNFKGAFTKDTVEVFTGISGASCGIRFSIGGHYILYGTAETYFFDKDVYDFPKGENKFWVNNCSRTRRKRNLEIDALEKIKR